MLTDRQGSLRALYNGSGLVQSFSYDAWGNRRSPSTGNALTTSELVTANSITARGYTCHEHMDEFGLINMNARIYDPALGMFISVDPLAQEYYNTYPYAYCGGDPVNAVDPTGESTWVVPNGDGTYRVVGGDIYDGDLTIYSLSFQLGTFAFDPLGASLTITSFYDSDANNGEGAWAYGSIIDPYDDSGRVFLNDFITNTPEIGYYMENATGGELYDFKRTNGTEGGDKKLDMYRGMPIATFIYASARDIGNYAAGYIAGAYQIPWKYARKEFDKLQSKQEGKPAIEGISSQNAQYVGWQRGKQSKGVIDTIKLWYKSAPLIFNYIKSR